MSGERTTIVVSHRFGSARLCDRILVLKEGRLLENGTHGELLSQGGRIRPLMGFAGAVVRRGGSEIVGYRRMSKDCDMLLKQEGAASIAYRWMIFT